MIENIFARAHAAPDSFRSVRLELLTWFDIELHDALMKDWEESQPKGSVSVLSARGSFRKRKPAKRLETGRSEQRFRFWFESENRWRSEFTPVSGITLSDILANSRYWVIQEDSGNPREVDPAQGRENLRQICAAMMIDPLPLLGKFNFRNIDPIVHIGRPAKLLQGVPRVSTDPSSFPLEGSDEYEVIVDDERGILLKIAALANHATVGAWEVTEVEFDEVFPDELFTPEYRSLSM